MNKLTCTAYAFFLCGSSSVYAQNAGSVDIGVGLGIPYGVLGGNVEVFVIDNLSLHASLGTTVIAGAGYGAGVQYYFGKEGSWSPNISLHYGTYGVIGASDDDKSSKNDIEDEQFEGLVIGGGVRKMWGQHGLSIGGHYALDSDLEDRQDELEDEGYEFEDSGFGASKFKISVGYAFSF
jgi:hypothetical protein